MTSLADILASKKAQLSTPETETVIDNSDLFFLNVEISKPVLEETPPENVKTERNKLLLFCILVNVSAHRSNLFANGSDSLRFLAAWLGPFPQDYLPYIEQIPQFMRSFALWRVGAVLDIPPAKLWPVFKEALLIDEKIFLDKKLPMV